METNILVLLEYRQDSFGCYDNFPEKQEFINKVFVEECCKENISVDQVFFSINNDCYVVKVW